MLNNRLTNLFQSIIVQEDLIDTGALLRSINVYTTLTGDTLIINITCEDYAKYLNSNYRLIKQFEEDPIFTEEVLNEFVPYVEQKVVDALEGTFNYQEDPTVLVLLNGV